MKLKFYGTRGSIPTPGPSTVMYGGNTTCLELRAENDAIYIIDAGSGIRELGNDLMKQGSNLEMKLLFTHNHWDHIQGFPFFAPPYIAGNKLEVYACDSRLQKVLNDQQKNADGNKTTEVKKKIKEIRAISHKEPEVNHPKRVVQAVMNTYKKHFPVPLEAMGAEIKFYEVRKNEIIEGPITAFYKFLQLHPQGYTYWKFEENGKSMVFASDYESDGFMKTGIKGSLGSLDKKFVAFAKDVNVLVLDGQYTPEQYQKCKGWGHNDIEQACHIAKAANVKTLVLTHHDPMNGDEKIDEMCQHTVDYMRSLDKNIKVVFAKEKMIIEVKSERVIVFDL